MPETYEEIMAIKKRNDEFSAWRTAKAREMPALAARVFALRRTGYSGCGFYWGMERDLGTCISRLNNYDDGGYYHGPDAITAQIVLEVLVEGLEEDVADAERKMPRARANRWPQALFGFWVRHVLPAWRAVRHPRRVR